MILNYKFSHFSAKIGNDPFFSGKTDLLSTIGEGMLVVGT
jgi:hypothetical protein